jgi:arylsulfatase
MRNKLTHAVLLALLLCLPLAGLAQEAQVDRTELPIKGPWYPPITTLDARDAKAPPIFEVKLPKGAPNVVVSMMLASAPPARSAA